jgi:hypothetical protein
MWNVQLLDATSLDDAGYVLAYQEEDNVTKVDLCDAAQMPACVNYRPSRDPHDMNEPQTIFKIGSVLGEMGLPVFREGWAKLKLATDNAALTRGDPVVCVGGGKIDKYTPTAISQGTDTAPDVETRFDELATIVGHVEEEDAAVGTTAGPSQDKVLCKLSIRAIGIIT